MFIVERSDAVCKNPVIPGVLPALVVHLVFVPFLRFGQGLHFHHLGLVEHVHVEAEDFFVLLELLWRLVPSWSHVDDLLKMVVMPESWWVLFASLFQKKINVELMSGRKTQPQSAAGLKKN